MLSYSLYEGTLEWQRAGSHLVRKRVIEGKTIELVQASDEITKMVILEL